MVTLAGEDNLIVVEARIKENEAEGKRLAAVRDALKEKNVRDSLTVTYSLDRKLYYVSDCLNMPAAWFSSVKITTRPAESSAPFMGGFVQTTLASGETYWREYYPFNFWKVKVGDERRVPVTLDEEFVKDYVAWAVQQWKWKGYDEGEESSQCV